MRRGAPIIAILLAVALGGALGLAAANIASSPGATPTPSRPVVAGGTSAPTSAPTSSTGPTSAPTPAATPTPTPVPTPTLVAAPLDGVLVTPEQAAQHPIAVMIDDLSPARPQSGFTSASVVWHAPAEGGIPRYMMVFQEKMPTAVGPVRSSRYYYIAWASEIRAMYVHAGGSPQALAALRANGNGKWVYNAEDFRWEGVYLWRIKQRLAPHNVYSDGTHLRQLARAIHAKDGPTAPVWKFAPDFALIARPVGGQIDVGYRANHITYRYDRATNTYKRSVTGSKRQLDAANGQQVAPKNVVIMLMHFGPLNDGHPNKHRLEATIVGKGPAWIATNGRTIKGTWRKAGITKPTRFYDAAGHEVTLTVGQTFVQVLATGSAVTIRDGKVPPPPKPDPWGAR